MRWGRALVLLVLPLLLGGMCPPGPQMPGVYIDGSAQHSSNCVNLQLALHCDGMTTRVTLLEARLASPTAGAVCMTTWRWDVGFVMRPGDKKTLTAQTCGWETFPGQLQELIYVVGYKELSTAERRR